MHVIEFFDEEPQFVPIVVQFKIISGKMTKLEQFQQRLVCLVGNHGRSYSTFPFSRIPWANSGLIFSIWTISSGNRVSFIASPNRLKKVSAFVMSTMARSIMRIFVYPRPSAQTCAEPVEASAAYFFLASRLFFSHEISPCFFASSEFDRSLFRQF